jgi:hypothetical protein
MPSWSDERGGREAFGQLVWGGGQLARKAASCWPLAKPFSPGGRMLLKPPPSPVPSG